MVDSINSINGGLSPIQPNSGNALGKASEVANGQPSFLDFLESSMESVNEVQLNADDMVGKLATGEIQDYTQVMNAVQKADMTFEMMMEIRNKLVDAYEEVLRMRI